MASAMIPCMPTTHQLCPAFQSDVCRPVLGGVLHPGIPFPVSRRDDYAAHEMEALSPGSSQWDRGEI